jgi:hypothetical protein
MSGNLTPEKLCCYDSNYFCNLCKDQPGKNFQLASACGHFLHSDCFVNFNKNLGKIRICYQCGQLAGTLHNVNTSDKFHYLWNFPIVQKKIELEGKSLKEILDEKSEYQKKCVKLAKRINILNRSNRGNNVKNSIHSLRNAPTRPDSETHFPVSSFNEMVFQQNTQPHISYPSTAPPATQPPRMQFAMNPQNLFTQNHPYNSYPFFSRPPWYFQHMTNIQPTANTAPPKEAIEESSPTKDAAQEFNKLGKF